MLAKKYLYEPRKLRDLALQEFRRALRNDRMIAITGSMSNEALGYFNWKGLKVEIADIATDLIEAIGNENGDLDDVLRYKEAITFEQIKETIRQYAQLLKSDTGTDARVAIRVIRDLFDKLRVIPKSDRKPLDRFDDAVAELARFRHKSSAASALRPLIEGLGIRRFATLNYDFELERAFMLRRDERRDFRADESKWQQKDPPKDPPPDFRRYIGDATDFKPIRESASHRLTRMMGDGILVESDWVQRERPDRLLEFAVGSTEVDRHIMHLHGRADDPKSMVVDIHDYDELYRRNDLYRSAFEHGHRVLLGGNPTVFVGLGMSENEINDRLQDFVSNGPTLSMAPAFVIWNTLDWSFKNGDEVKREVIEARMAEKRVDFLVRLGIHIIYDRDIIDETTDKWLVPAKQTYPEITAPKDFKDILKEYHKAIESDDAEKNRIKLELLSVTLHAMPLAMAYLAQFSSRPWLENKNFSAGKSSRWRSIASRLHPNRYSPTGSYRKPSPHRLWGTPLLAASITNDPPPDFPAFAQRDSSESDPAIALAVARSGWGRGRLAERIAQADSFAASKVESALQQCSIDNRLLIHAGFSYDADSTLIAIAQFLAVRCNRNDGEDIIEDGAIRCRQKAFASGRIFETTENCLIILNGIDRFFSISGNPLSAEIDMLFRSIAAHAGENGIVRKIQWLILGTQRVERYFKMLNAQVFELEQKDRVDIIGLAQTEEREGRSGDQNDAQSYRSSYLDWVKYCYGLAESSVRSENANNEDFLKRVLDRHGPDKAAVARLSHAMEIDPDSVRRAFFSGYLAPSYLNRIDVFCPETFEILRTMAFIGAPVELIVLLYAPKIRKIIDEVNRTYSTDEDTLISEHFRAHSDEEEKLKGAERDIFRFRAVVKKLISLGLIIQVEPTPSFLGTYKSAKNSSSKDTRDIYLHYISKLPDRDFLTLRFGLHRSLATELRERHGAPITEAKLSTSFNMSLFAAQPDERYTPEPRFHDELGQLVDRLIGSWQEGSIFLSTDDSGMKKILKKIDGIFKDDSKLKKLLNKSPELRTELDRLLVNRDMKSRIKALHQLASPASSACLRAALAIVRGYYSTGNLLLSKDYEPSRSEGHGALSAHANRLDRILRNFGNISTARHIYRILIDHLCTSEDDRRLARQAMGPEPFYPDDIVWLHNERGVLKMIQGAIYSARRSFSLAEHANREVEPDYPGHNWRRINLNLVGLMIERGRLPRAERRLDRIEATIQNPDWLASSPKSSGEDRIAEIHNLFGSDDGKLAAIIHPEFCSEELLVVGLTTGYRGLISQMRGEFAEASQRYKIATRILSRIGEMRAYGLFMRHHASMGSMMMNGTDRLNAIDKAIVAVDSVQQLDLSHRLRILRAVINRSSDSSDIIRYSLHDLHRALQYSRATDCFRVRIEAGAALARHMRMSGDFEAALNYASDALATATRFGHALQKIWLRVEIGLIMIERGSTEAGKGLLRSAERAAIRTGYQRVIEHVQRSHSRLASFRHTN